MTENKSPVLPDGTSYLSKTTNNFLDGIADFAFLTILEYPQYWCVCPFSKTKLFVLSTKLPVVTFCRIVVMADSSNLTCSPTINLFALR